MVVSFPIPEEPFRYLVSCNPRRSKRPWEDAVALFLRFILQKHRKTEAYLNFHRGEELVGRHYGEIKRLWLERGYAKPIKNYRAGYNATLYKLASHGRPVLEYTLQTEAAIKRSQRPAKPLKEEEATQLPFLPSVALQARLMASGRVSVDKERAKLVSKGEPDTPFGYFSALSVEALWGTQVRISTDGYRIYHPLQTVPKEYRHCLLFDGEPAIGLDVANCFLVVVNYLTRVSPSFEEDSFSGVVYEKLAEEMSTTREIAKHSLVSAISVSPDQELNLNCYEHQAWGLFQRWYPEEAAWLRNNREPFLSRYGTIKEVIYPKLAGEETLRMLPAAERLLEQGVPVVTVHDAVLTGEGHEGTVRAELKKAFPGASIRISEF